MEYFRENVRHGTKDCPIAVYAHLTNDFFYHHHAEYELLLIEKGGVTAVVDGDTIVADAGDILFIRKEEPHYLMNRLAESCMWTALLFDAAAIGDGEDFARNYLRDYVPRRCQHAEPHLLRLLEQMIPCVQGCASDSMNKLKARCLLLEILCQLYTEPCYAIEPTQEDHRRFARSINEMTRFIEEHYAEPISIRRLADSCRYSPSYMIKIFRQYTGMTPIAWLLHVRITKACCMLEETEHSITDIASACGFENASYFNRVFLRTMQCTPTEYRKSKLPSDFMDI